MANSAGLCRKAGFFPGCHAETETKKTKTLLDYKEMSSPPKKTMSCLGIPMRGVLLVY
jgi:hypothetical protein